MKTWKINYMAQFTGGIKHDYTFSVTQRFKPTMVAARQMARNHLDPLIDSRRSLKRYHVNWINHVAQ